MIQLHYDIFSNFWYHILAHIEVAEPYAVYNHEYSNISNLNIPQEIREFLISHLSEFSHFPFYKEIYSIEELKESLVSYFHKFSDEESSTFELQKISNELLIFLETEFKEYSQKWQSELALSTLNVFKSKYLDDFIQALKLFSSLTEIAFMGDLHIWLIDAMPDTRGKSVGFPDRHGFAIAVPETDKMSEDICFSGVHELAHYFTDRMLLKADLVLSLDKSSEDFIRRESLADFLAELYFQDIGKQLTSKWKKEFIPPELISKISQNYQRLTTGIEVIHFGDYSKGFPVDFTSQLEPVKEIYFIEKKTDRLYFFLPLIGRMVGVPMRYLKNLSPLEFGAVYVKHFVKAGLLMPIGFKYYRQSIDSLPRCNGFVRKVRFHMTNSCNLRCKYCYLSAGTTPGERDDGLFSMNSVATLSWQRGLCSNSAFDKRESVPYDKSLGRLAREHRKNPTEAELMVWDILKDRQFESIKFRRQKPILDYIADFYCAELLLVIEVDGDYHNGQEEYDHLRTDKLNELGINVIRYTNHQVINSIDFVKEDLSQKIQKIIVSKPSLPGEGDELHTFPETPLVLASGEVFAANISAEVAISHLTKLYGNDLNGIEVEFHGGGEPTLMIAEIKKIVAYIDQNTTKRTIRLQTNGVFNQDVFDWIVGNNVAVSVSIDGDKEINDTQRTGGTQAFEKIIANIRHLVERGVNVSTVSVITEYSQYKVSTIYEFIKSLGVRAMMMNPVHSFLGRSQQHDYPAKRDADLMTFSNNFLEILHKANKDGIYLVSDFLPDFFQYIPRNYQCDACKAGVGIYSNGDVCSCTRAYDLGQGSTNPFVWANVANEINILTKNETRLINRTAENMPECNHCLLKWNCAGDCLLQCHELNGDMYKIDEDRCKAKKQFIVEYLRNSIPTFSDTVLLHFPAVTPMLPPPGVNYLANYLINKGVNCEVIDINKDMYFNYKEEWRKTFSFQDNYLKDIQFKLFIDDYFSKLFALLTDRRHRYLGISCFDNTFEMIKLFLGQMKLHKVENVFLGGPDRKSTRLNSSH